MRFFSALFTAILLYAIAIIPAQALELNLGEKEKKAQAFYSIQADSDSKADSTSSNSSVSLSGSAEDRGAYSSTHTRANVSSVSDTSSNDSVGLNVNLTTWGNFLSTPQYITDGDGNVEKIQAEYTSGAYSGIETSFTIGPSQNTSHSLWGKEVDGQPVFLQWNYTDSVRVASSYNLNTNAFHQGYEIGQEAFWDEYRTKFDGGGNNSLVHYQVPKEFRLKPDEVNVEAPMPEGIKMNRTSLSVTTSSNEGPEYTGPAYTHQSGDNKSKTYISQIGNETTLFAESGFSIATHNPLISSKTDYSAELSHSWETSIIPDDYVQKDVISDVPTVKNAPDSNLGSRYAATASIAKYWANKLLPPEQAQEFTFEKITQDLQIIEQNNPPQNIGIEVEQMGEYWTNVMNQYFDTHINGIVEIDDVKKVGSVKATFHAYKSAEAYAEIKGNLEDEYPMLVGGKFYDYRLQPLKNSNNEWRGHTATAYGLLEVTNPDDPTENVSWLALNDTYSESESKIARNIDGVRSWEQDVNSSEHKWYPAPPTTRQDYIIFPEEKEALDLDYYITVEPESYPIVLVHGWGSDATTWDTVINAFEDKLLESGGVINIYMDDKTMAEIDENDISDPVTEGDFYAVNYTRKTTPSSDESPANEDAIVKQGKGLGIAIEKILDKTKSDKVILIAHSMGGLASREYIQNIGCNNVEKLITVGTPHQGSFLANLASEFLADNITREELITQLQNYYGSRFLTNRIWNYMHDNLIDIRDPFSNAVRDMRTDSSYLNGGAEQNTPLLFRDRDTSVDGDENDVIVGLNTKRLPDSIEYTSLFSSPRILSSPAVLIPNDGAVAVSSQLLGIGEAIRIAGEYGVSHVNQLEYPGYILDALGYPFSLHIHGHSPIDLIVTDPKGFQIGKSIRTINKAFYSEIDTNFNNDFEPSITILEPVEGEYLIEVIPCDYASITDIFSLEISYAGHNTILADKVEIKELAGQPYSFVLGELKSSPVPEPCSLILLLLGLLGVYRIRRA